MGDPELNASSLPITIAVWVALLFCDLPRGSENMTASLTLLASSIRSKDVICLPAACVASSNSLAFVFARWTYL